ncbi:hypothetical protein EVAR_49851_1 [Eumeta japonica]|uniref:Uncharacterized protein n=1 Tax=Eumeta variegata TaxID=151549 RepID=A0A4C1XZ63_EUMVA|nr:hypothetical protein EVAR_49851_1 [Eumeta japonica]
MIRTVSESSGGPLPLPSDILFLLKKADNELVTLLGKRVSLSDTFVRGKRTCEPSESKRSSLPRYTRNPKVVISTLLSQEQERRWIDGVESGRTGTFTHWTKCNSGSCYLTPVYCCGWESLWKSVTLGNVTMSHRTRERPAECLASLSHSTMIGLPRAQH